MKQRQRKRAFNFSHPIKTFNVTSDIADFMNRLNTSERATFFSKALHQFLNGGKPRYSQRNYR